MSVVCCQAEVSSSGWSLFQRSPAEGNVSECNREACILVMRRIWPRRKGEIFKVKVPLSSINHLKPSSYCMYLQICGPGSLVGIATDYGLDGPGIESQWGRDFPPRSDRPWGPPSLVYNGYQVFPGGKERPGRAADHCPPSSAEVFEE